MTEPEICMTHFWPWGVRCLSAAAGHATFGCVNEHILRDMPVCAAHRQEMRDGKMLCSVCLNANVLNVYVREEEWKPLPATRSGIRTT